MHRIWSPTQGSDQIESTNGMALPSNMKPHPNVRSDQNYYCDSPSNEYEATANRQIRSQLAMRWLDHRIWSHVQRSDQIKITNVMALPSNIKPHPEVRSDQKYQCDGAAIEYEATPWCQLISKLQMWRRWHGMWSHTQRSNQNRITNTMALPSNMKPQPEVRWWPCHREWEATPRSQIRSELLMW